MIIKYKECKEIYVSRHFKAEYTIPHRELFIKLHKKGFYPLGSLFYLNNRIIWTVDLTRLLAPNELCELAKGKYVSMGNILKIVVAEVQSPDSLSLTTLQNEALIDHVISDLFTD